MRDQDGYGPLYADKAEHAAGARVSTTPERQLSELQAAWDEVAQSHEAKMGLLSNKEMAKRALKMTNLGCTPEMALHKLGISQEPQRLSTMMPSAGEYNI